MTHIKCTTYSETEKVMIAVGNCPICRSEQYLYTDAKNKKSELLKHAGRGGLCHVCVTKREDIGHA